jgi:fructosamine-3-kinase
MTDPKPQGKRFSHVYLDRGKPDNDSPTMRRRLAALIPSLADLKDFGAELPRELGVDVPSSQWGYYWTDFFRDCDVTVALERSPSRGAQEEGGHWPHDMRARHLDRGDDAHF